MIYGTIRVKKVGDEIMGSIAIILPFVCIIMIILIFVLMFNPKLRGKLMSNQIKATKYMVNESKEDIQDITTNIADATKDGVEITTRAIKNGITQNLMFCKHCGYEIDSDSKFCKKCGKEQ